jgi:molybdopterin-guanine dinucleotide biosynthesis protein A
MLTCAILAGGDSRRFGREKGLALLGGKPLIQHVIERLHGMGEETLLITNRPEAYRFLGLPIFEDRIPGGGALSGLHAALVSAKYPVVLLVACDMPFLNRSLLAHMIGLASRVDVVIPLRRGQYEPLHALYARACLPAVETTLTRQSPRMVDFLPQVNVLPIGETELRRFDLDGRSFFNINTEEDMRRAEAMLASE